MLGQNSVLDKLLSKTCSACVSARQTCVMLLGHAAASEHYKVKKTPSGSTW